VYASHARPQRFILALAGGFAATTLLVGCAQSGVDESACPGSVGWTDAKSVEGQEAVVRGTVAATSYRPDVNGEPTFINVGKDYPDPARFTIVIWGEDRASFSSAPEVLYDGAKVCATGSVTKYGGLPQMNVTSEDQIEIIR
jgi:hypothetical protein